MSYWAKNSDAHNLGNRHFSYFGFLGYKKELAADVRIYRQDLFCSKYNRDKKDSFASQGLFANYARGSVGLLRAAAAAVSGLLSCFVYVFIGLKAWAGAFHVGMVTQYIASL